MLACRTVLPSDLQYLTDEDVEEIGMSGLTWLCCADFPSGSAGGALTRVEKNRLQAAVKAQCGAPLFLAVSP